MFSKKERELSLDDLMLANMPARSAQGRKGSQTEAGTTGREKATRKENFN